MIVSLLWSTRRFLISVNTFVEVALDKLLPPYPFSHRVSWAAGAGPRISTVPSAEASHFFRDQVEVGPVSCHSSCTSKSAVRVTMPVSPTPHKIKGSLAAHHVHVPAVVEVLGKIGAQLFHGPSVFLEPLEVPQKVAMRRTSYVEVFNGEVDPGKGATIIYSKRATEYRY